MEVVILSVFFEWSAPFILFYVVTALWILEFALFPSKAKDGDFEERMTFKRILYTILFVIVATIGLTFFGWFTLVGAAQDVLRIVGITLYVLGLLLRYVSTIYLGRHFTRNVDVSGEMELISTGPYRFLRHPLYLGLFLLTFAVPIFFANFLVMALAVILMGRVINQRMTLEEREMERVLGDRYREWKQVRYRFIPFIY